MNNTLTRRRLLAAASAMGLGWESLAAFAQSANAARIIVGFPPGGTADSLARVLAPLMTPPGQSMIVDNKPGASGQLAAEAVRMAAPDGNALLLTPSSILSLVPHLYKKPMFDSLGDFAAVGGVCDHSFGFAVPGTSPIKSFAEFVDWSRNNAKEATFATPGSGTAPHFLGTILGREIGAPLVHVPYKGVAPGLQDLIGGQVASTFNPLPTLLEYHKTGRIRILAVTNPSRVASLPAVPTFTELKRPALELVEWYGLFTSSKAPADAVAKLQNQLRLADGKPELTAAAKRLEVEPRPADATELRHLLEADYRRWQGIVKTTGISLDS
ncbi:tripartite tricarboxylate transporter substrate-binding protein [Variovorax sp. NFACC27]|uniref:tripartite tricarboxylate transporter substrate-binding protein n=1 Tax=unclassified Variovorax TaxID=663243 RepID=UPI003AAD24BC